MTILEAYGTDQDEVIEEAIEKYKSKFKIYGHSWKRMTISELSKRLNEEITEWQMIPESADFDEDYNELLDIINVATMLSVRLKDYKRENGE